MNGLTTASIGDYVQYGHLHMQYGNMNHGPKMRINYANECDAQWLLIAKRQSLCKKLSLSSVNKLHGNLTHLEINICGT